MLGNNDFIVMGIDLAGKSENPTGICFLYKNKLIFSTLFTNDEILSQVYKKNPSLIVIDAPLSLPKGRCCLSNKCSCSQNGGHFRVAEIEMRKFGRTLPLTFKGMRMLTERGIILKEKLEKNYKILESHPHTIQKILGHKNLEVFKKYYDIPLDISEHEWDAALLVLCGIYYIKGQFMEFGDPLEGLIILPQINED
jgi:predicted nuclease with RNAse H fold